MTVGKLIKILRDYDPKMIVVMSSDGEGNTFSPLAEAATGRYEADSTYSGYLVDSEEDPEGGKPAIVLWPTN